jgi:glycosyltransferase involved in cell wall biosynthesis
VIDAQAASRRRILLVTVEPMSTQMAGPAIRCLEIGKQLSAEFEVTVLSAQASSDKNFGGNGSNLKILSNLSKGEVLKLASQADILIIQGNVLKLYPQLAKLGKYLVIDLYDPYLFSMQVQYEEDTTTASASFRMMHQVLQKHMLACDFSICASERQRDYWIGRFCAQGRIDPRLHRFDPSLRKLIDVVPFGLPSEAPRHNGNGPRAIFKNIKANDPILLWGGGVWDWFDPISVIKAVDQLKATIPDIRLVFMGTKSPNAQVPLMSMALKARQLAESLGLIDKHVFFPDQWIGYEERASFLLEADIAVSSHFDLAETRFAFRTRVIDYLWAGLPIITTGGDSLADLVEAETAGIVVPYQDVEAWRAAISKMLTDTAFKQKCRAGSAALAQRFTWSRAVKPLLHYCRNPYHLPAHRPVTMPSVIERLKAVYSRGGRELVVKRSAELIKSYRR